MTVHFYLHTPLPDDQNERIAVLTVARLLNEYFGDKKDIYYLVANIDPDHNARLKEYKKDSGVPLSQLDGLLFGPNFVAILEFKRYFHIEIESRNDQPVKKWGWFALSRKGKVESKIQITIGSKKKSPFRQVNDARIWWMSLFKELSADLLGKKRSEELKSSWSHLCGCVLFQPFLSKDSIIPAEIRNIDWFHVAGVNEVGSLVYGLHSFHLQLEQSEVESLIGSKGLGAQPWTELQDKFKNQIGILHIKEREQDEEAFSWPVHFYDQIVVGRLTGMQTFDINLRTKSISRPHLVINVHEGHLYAYDMNSKFGTMDELGNPIDGELGKQLRDGDAIYLGHDKDKNKACRIRFERETPLDSTTTAYTKLP